MAHTHTHAPSRGGDPLEAETQDIQQTSLPGQETRFPFPALSEAIHGPQDKCLFPPQASGFPIYKMGWQSISCPWTLGVTVRSRSLERSHHQGRLLIKALPCGDASVQTLTGREASPCLSFSLWKVGVIICILISKRLRGRDAGGDRNSPHFIGCPESRERGPHEKIPGRLSHTQHDLWLSILPCSPSSQYPVKCAWARLSSPGPSKGGEGHGLSLPSQATRSLSLLLLPSPMNTHLKVLGSPG